MNTSFVGRGLLVVLLAASFTTLAQPVTFTTDTLIDFGNTNYEGAEIVVTNCTVTINGRHSFASIQVLKKGLITHSPAPYGQAGTALWPASEQLSLTSTNPATVSHSNVVLASIVVADSSGTIVYTNEADYVVRVVNYEVAIARTENSAIPDGATVTVGFLYWASVPPGLDLVVAGDAIVEPGATINVSGKGYNAQTGTGHGGFFGNPMSGGGAGYGGFGGSSASGAPGGSVYGQPFEPFDLGSGGGPGMNDVTTGGGVIKITAGGVLRVDGAIISNGAGATDEAAGGGSGGSIWLICQTLTGAGLVAADGGAGEPPTGGGGGGGRIALHYETNAFSGSLHARGGFGGGNGGAGTVFLKPASPVFGSMLVDNGGLIGTNTPLHLPLASVSVQNGAVLSPPKGTTLPRLTIGENGWVVSSSPAQFTVNGDLDIQRGGNLTMDGAGFLGGQGPGAGRIYTSFGGGAGYGGFGAPGAFATTGGGPTYGSFATPTDPGSGGGGNPGSPNALGGSGGGALALTVLGKLNVDGRISADGRTSSGPGTGGGSGGSLYLTANTLSGAGMISASGAPGNGYGGGGGGGRIAVYLQTNEFSGAMRAFGAGAGTNFGGPGSVYQKTGDAVPQLSYDNNGNPGSSLLSSGPEAVALNIEGGTTLAPYPPPTLASLRIGSNAWLRLTNYPVTVTGSAVVEEGGGISANGAGYAGGNGPGAGRSLPAVPPGGGQSLLTGGGAGHGGYGASSTYGAAGGITYATAQLPSQQGSGGGMGSDSSPNNFGGAGGGVIRLIVSNSLTLNGVLSANGVSTTNRNSGGGSGGSIWITAGSLEGTGSISTDGGGGNGYGGGGGGGRIGIYSPTNLFRGIVTAYGGASNGRVGGPGTVFLFAGFSVSETVDAQLIVDNGGRPGSPSDLLALSDVYLPRITLRGAATAPLISTIRLRNLLIETNCWILISNRFAVVTSSNVIIQAGGGILADGGGYPSGQGIGPGRTYSYQGVYAGGGGAYGGYGGSGGLSQAFGGNPYGVMVQLNDVGSGGGAAGSTNYGGAGGGFINLRVTGTLSLDGILSANGLPGVGQNSGGGSGGSVYVDARSISGNGMILANGGAGLGLGGGGGGGRISILIYQGGSNNFTGVIRAYGGAGFSRGGAGTICSPGLNSVVPSVLIDNGGFWGTNTTTGDGSVCDVIIRNGGALSAGREPQFRSIRNLYVGSNAWVFVSSQPLSLIGDVTIESGGGIIGDSAGSPSGQGQGAGRGNYNGLRGGGGYGGMGGGNVYGGGQAYGNFMPPYVAGSGGASGSGSTFAPLGGSGGGALRLAMSPGSTLRLDGRISANGGPGDQNSGGGSGGSVWISTGTLLGAGSISADGGSGNGLGCGGGGGRIMLEYRTNLLAGAVTALGGPGYARGGAGTIYYRPWTQNIGQVVLDNGGSQGMISSLGYSGSYAVDLIVTNGATFTPVGQIALQNLYLAGNGWIWFSNRASDSITITRNAYIDPSSGVTADGKGYPALQGPGHGVILSSSFGLTGSGAGHGGFGGSSFSGTPGGAAYDFITTPSMAGSGGGNGQGNPPYNPGGAGGGIINLSVTGSLENNGRISADGLAGLGESSGGGAGGTVSLNLGTLTGSGVISANGGAGNGLGGGGGGGLIRILGDRNSFAGAITAFGGPGAGAGGAGTVFTTSNMVVGGQISVDNGGQMGTNTPVALSSPLDLAVQRGGVVCPASDYLIVSNLVVAEGGLVTSISPQSNLDLTILGNVLVASNGQVSVDGRGFGQLLGPGAGLSTNDIGSGAGYGAQGGASSMLPGGPAYGSITQPIDFGSGGGSGFGSTRLGSEGGGAIRLSVGGTLTVDGSISANGNPGLQDSAGGGSGGSLLLLANAFEGGGLVSANGGAGEVFHGGGGAGGRIALYARTNNFTGQVLALGGDGWGSGGNGTLFYSSNFYPPVVTALSPTGIISNGVSAIELEFNMPVLPGSVDLAYFALSTPFGVLDRTNIGISASGASALRFSFPMLSAIGDYTVVVEPAMASDIFGQPLSQSYTGAFTIVLPLIQGVVTNAEGQPVPGVLVQPSIGSAAVTDSNGVYAIGAPPDVSISISPSCEGLVFVPRSRSYYPSGSGSLTNQDFLAVTSIMPIITWQQQGTNIFMSWSGIPGVVYRVFYSPNLVDWEPFSDPFPGTSGPMQFALPIEGDPARFYRLVAANYSI